MNPAARDLDVCENPFDWAGARAKSSYAAFNGQTLVPAPVGPPVTASHVDQHRHFRARVLSDVFSCLGAKAAIRRRTYATGAYGRLGDEAFSAGLARDLYTFAQEPAWFGSPFTSFIAFFQPSPLEADAEQAFESALWQQLQMLSDLDRDVSSWDASVSPNPSDPAFSFSFAGKALFVVGLHPDSSRSSRRFRWPTLVFNPHAQFGFLRQSGAFEGLRRQTRTRELQIDGSLNPNLADFGQASEARQYSGRQVDPAWRCPFRPR